MRIGLINFPPFAKDEYAEVKFNKVVSAEPSEIDKSSSGIDEHKEKGSYKFKHREEIERNIELFDLNRNIGHISKPNIINSN